MGGKYYFILVHFKIKYLIFSYCVDACSCLAMAVGIFFNVPNNSKIEHVLVSLTYKRHQKNLLGGQFYFILLQNKDFGWLPMVSSHVLVKLQWLL